MNKKFILAHKYFFNFQITVTFTAYMYDFIEGKVDKIKPDNVVINANGVGYHINISLATYDSIKKQNPLRLYVHQIVREDHHALYGFADTDERTLFTQLISVSGIGANTGRLILSSLRTNDLVMAILNGNVPLISSIKGIGPKTAQRMVLELKDKLGKPKTGGDAMFDSIFAGPSQEALQALIALGFNKQKAEKAIQKAMSSKDNENDTVELIIKNSLKLL
jgi:Holliday junction DNA helicase RuvA